MSRWFWLLLLPCAAFAQFSQPSVVPTTYDAAQTNLVLQDVYDRLGTKFSTSKAGLVPKSSGGTTSFLRADGSWAVPPGTYSYTLPPRPPHAWDTNYTGAAEPPASTPAWTLTGIDHASVSGGILTITNCGTDENYYYIAPTTAVSGQSVWQYTRFKVQAGVTSLSFYPIYLGVNGKIVYAIAKSATFLVLGSGGYTSHTADCSSDYVESVARLGFDGTYDVWINRVLLVSGTAYTSSFPYVAFGKIGVISDTNSFYIDRVAYATCNDSGLPN